MAGEDVRSCGRRRQYARGIAICRLGSGGTVVLAVPEWMQCRLSFVTAKEVWI